MSEQALQKPERTKSGAVRKSGRNQIIVPQTRVARKISIDVVIAVLERETLMSRSSLDERIVSWVAWLNKWSRVERRWLSFSAFYANLFIIAVGNASTVWNSRCWCWSKFNLWKMIHRKSVNYLFITVTQEFFFFYFIIYFIILIILSVV